MILVCNTVPKILSDSGTLVCDDGRCMQRISGLQVIFVGLNFLSIDANYLYIVKGLIILVACAIDMRKYLVRK